MNEFKEGRCFLFLFYFGGIWKIGQKDVTMNDGRVRQEVGR